VVDLTSEKNVFYRSWRKYKKAAAAGSWLLAVGYWPFGRNDLTSSVSTSRGFLIPTGTGC